MRNHPLVVHYHCPPEAMHLVRAHGDVEGGHRSDAWTMILTHTPKELSPLSACVVETCATALERWLKYRDGVAERMGLRRG